MAKSNDQMLADLSSQIIQCLHALCQLVGCTQGGHRIGGRGRWVPVIHNSVNHVNLLIPMAFGHGLMEACAPFSHQAW